MSEFTEEPTLTSELFRSKEQMHLGKRLLIQGDMLGFGKWQEMTDLTEKTGSEKGLIVSANGTKIITSRIIEGMGERPDPDRRNKTLSPEIYLVSPLGHSIRKLLHRASETANIHTHPDGEGLRFLPHKIFSGRDLARYVELIKVNRLNGTKMPLFLMLDGANAHLLMGVNPYADLDAIDTDQIEKDSFKSALDNTKLIAEVRNNFATELAKFGIKYYMAEKKVNENGFVDFKDVLIMPIKSHFE